LRQRQLYRPRQIPLVEEAIDVDRYVQNNHNNLSSTSLPAPSASAFSVFEATQTQAPRHDARPKKRAKHDDKDEQHLRLHVKSLLAKMNLTFPKKN